MCTFIYYIHTHSATGVHDYVYELDIYADMNKAITVFVSLKSFDQRKLTMEKAKRHFILWFSTAKLGQDQEYWKVDCDTGKVLPGSGLGGCWWWRGSWWGWWWGWGPPPHPPMMRWGLELKSGMLAVFGSWWLSRTEEHNWRLGNISQKPRATRHRLVGTGYSCAAEEGVWIWHAAAASSSTSACRGGAAPATASATIAILPSWCLASTLNLGV